MKNTDDIDAQRRYVRKLEIAITVLGISDVVSLSLLPISSWSDRSPAWAFPYMKWLIIADVLLYLCAVLAVKWYQKDVKKQEERMQKNEEYNVSSCL